MIEIFRDSPWPEHAKVVFVFNRLKITDDLNQLAWLLHVFGFVNALVIFEDGESFQIFHSKTIDGSLELTASRNFEFLFPEKLKNLQGYEFKVFVARQAPKINCFFNDHKNCWGVDITLMRIVAEQTNASLKLMGVNEHAINWVKHLSKALMDIEVDLTLKTSFKSIKTIRWPFINTFDESAYCAAIPFPPRLNLMDYFLSPFDLTTWAMIVASVTVSSLLWKSLSGRSQSAWRFAMAVAADFIGQEVKLHNATRMQTLLVKLCLLMSFIMGNSYQSLISASMMTSRDGIRMTTFEQLFDSSMPVLVDPVVLEIFHRSGRSISNEKMKVGRTLSTKEFSYRNVSWITRCDTLDYVFENVLTFPLNMYRLPETMMKSFETFYLRPLSPFQDLLQAFFDRFYESGIRQYWTRSMNRRPNSVVLIETDREENMLRFDDIEGIFFLFLVCLSLSCASFVFELIRFNAAKIKTFVRQKRSQILSKFRNFKFRK